MKTNSKTRNAERGTRNLFKLLAVAFLCSALPVPRSAFAADKINIIVPALYTGDTAVSRQPLTLTPVSPLPRSYGTNIFSRQAISRYTDTNGICTFSNILYGNYSLTVPGSPGTTWTFPVGTNLSGNVNIVTLLTNTFGNIPNPSSNYLTEAQSDARYSSITNAAGTTYTNRGDIPVSVISGGGIGTNISALLSRTNGAAVGMTVDKITGRTTAYAVLMPSGDGWTVYTPDLNSGATARGSSLNVGDVHADNNNLYAGFDWSPLRIDFSIGNLDTGDTRSFVYDSNGLFVANGDFNFQDRQTFRAISVDQITARSAGYAVLSPAGDGWTVYTPDLHSGISARGSSFNVGDVHADNNNLYSGFDWTPAFVNFTIGNLDTGDTRGFTYFTNGTFTADGDFNWQAAQTFHGINNASGTISGNGSGITNISASSIASGTVAPLRHGNTNAVTILNSSYGLFMHGTNPPVWQNYVSNFSGQINIIAGRMDGISNTITTNLTVTSSSTINGTLNLNNTVVLMTNGSTINTGVASNYIRSAFGGHLGFSTVQSSTSSGIIFGSFGNIFEFARGDRANAWQFDTSIPRFVAGTGIHMSGFPVTNASSVTATNVTAFSGFIYPIQTINTFTNFGFLWSNSPTLVCTTNATVLIGSNTPALGGDGREFWVYTSGATVTLLNTNGGFMAANGTISTNSSITTPHSFRSNGTNWMVAP